MRVVLAALAACFLVLSAPGNGLGGRIDDGDARELAKRIAKAKDGVDPALFEELAAVGDERSFKALEAAIGNLRRDELCAAVYRSLRHYAGGEDLGPRAIALLRREVGRGKTTARKRAATSALVPFGKPAVEVLEAILERNKDEGVRRIACDALVPVLGARGDVSSLELILEHASLAREPVAYVDAPSGAGEQVHRDVIRSILSAADEPEARALMFARLVSDDASRSWKLFLIELCAHRPGVDVSRALAGALGDGDSAVVLSALDALQARDDWDGYEIPLRALLRSREPALRKAAVMALGHLLFTQDAWHDEVLGLSRSKDAALRMGAIACLAELRIEPARARLFELLADEDWAVRAEALARVGAMRDAASVPLLIERLDAERGRLRRDVEAVLRTLTGLDLGRNPERWQRWWTDQTDGPGTFELPSFEEARAAERARIEAGQVGDTAATSFYGLDVVSERVAFLVDISGSMALPPGVFDPATSVPPGTRTRMHIAKEQLSSAVRGLEEGRYFNILFFESEVYRFSKRVVQVKGSTRAKALRFIDEQVALSATALFSALEMAFEDELIDTLYVLTDGAPTAGQITDIEDIRAEVRRWNATRHVKIHGVSMGQDSDLLRWLAGDTGGRYVRVD